MWQYVPLPPFGALIARETVFDAMPILRPALLCDCLGGIEPCASCADLVAA
jgi:hypothetical protein